MKGILLAFAVGVSLYSCKEAVSVPMDNETQVVQTSEVYKIEDLFCDFELLPLNTGTEGLFRNVNKLVFHDGHYYILDKSGKRQVLVFDRNGNYERSIGRVGRGQGEYTNIEDFTIDEDGGRVVILAYPSLVYVYDMEGRFLEQKKIEEHSMLWNIASHEHGFVCATNHQTYTEGEHAFLLYFFDKNFNFVSKRVSVLPEQMQMPPFVASPLMKKEGGGLVYFDTYTANRYDIDVSDSISIKSHKYLLDNFMPYEFFANAQEFVSKQTMYNYFLWAICIRDRLLAFYVDGQDIWGFVSELEKDAPETEAFKFDGWLPDLMCYADGTIYSVINARRLEENKSLFKEIPDSLYEQGNDIIFTFKCKKFVDP